MDLSQLLNVMARHYGAENGIKADALAAHLRVGPRGLRRLISAAREDGFAICGTPNAGYYLPTKPEELESACKFLEHRALRSLHLLARMRNVAMPELLGQLKLNQA